MEREITHIKQLYPDALYIGIADGAAHNWPFLKRHTSKQVTDFWHATEYLADVAEAIFDTEKEPDRKKQRLDEGCHKLKHLKEAAGRILKELKQRAKNIRGKIRLEKLNKAISYFTQQKSRMNYCAFVKQALPIGSGVTETVCKMISNSAYVNPA
jgi:hypothetical protein